MKFISAGRIEKEYIKINETILGDIQNQVIQVAFPKIFHEMTNYVQKLNKQGKQIQDQKELISNLKKENNRMMQILKNNNLL